MNILFAFAGNSAMLAESEPPAGHLPAIPPMLLNYCDFTKNKTQTPW